MLKYNKGIYVKVTEEQRIQLDRDVTKSGKDKSKYIRIKLGLEKEVIV